MNLSMQSSDSALLISNDPLLYEAYATLLTDRFRVHLNRVREEELRNSLLVRKPIFLIWDGRFPSPRWTSMIAWLRDHFHGLPIIAVVDENQHPLLSELSRMGINQVVNNADENVTQALILHISAILLDCGRSMTETMSGAWN